MLATLCFIIFPQASSLSSAAEKLADLLYASGSPKLVHEACRLLDQDAKMGSLDALYDRLLNAPASLARNSQSAFQEICADLGHKHTTVADQLREDKLLHSELVRGVDDDAERHSSFFLEGTRRDLFDEALRFLHETPAAGGTDA